MLQILIPTMQNIMMAVIPLAMMMALIAQREPGNLQKSAWRGMIMGNVGALAFVASKLILVFLKREIYEGCVLIPALGIEIFLLLYLWRTYRSGSLDKTDDIPVWVVFCLTAALFLHRGVEVYLFPVTFLIPPAGGLSQEFLLKWAGYFLGLGLTTLTGFAVYRVARVLSFRALTAVTAGGFGVVALQQLVTVVQMLLARGIIPMKKWLLAVMIPLINHQDWYLYLLLAVMLSLPVLLYVQRRPPMEAGLNPAQYRKILAVARKQLRWGTVVAVNILLVVLLSTVGKGYADQATELSPAVTVTVQQGEVRIPIDKVEDGRLHRFAYTASNGTVVRFIIIKKGGSAYGVGLDACDICGPTGYYEREDQVVCKLCDVVMNKATIGFKGGCNPVPLEYKVASGQIIISAQTLDKEKKRFQ
ncbi:MAG: DUF2318 domain-containing protein [Negativicutes bacterium]|nr:DUF2318 domain-containing protein [Negativicutes bacterium]